MTDSLESSFANVLGRLWPYITRCSLQGPSEFYSHRENCQGIVPTKIAIGVSGGADSIALILLLKEYFFSKNCELIALTVDHGLRPESLDEAKTVASLMQKMGIKHQILRWEGEKPQTSIQEKARYARHRLLRSYCRENDIGLLMLAHHLDDQEETLVMRYLRQSRLLGLSGMPALFYWPGLSVARPLLPFRKSVLKDFLRNKKVSWIEDPSNKNLVFSRIRIRQALRISKPWVVSYLSDFERLRGSFDRLLNQLINRYGKLFPEGYIELQRVPFDSLPTAFQIEILERVIMAVGGLFYPPRRQKLEIFLQKLQACEGIQFSFGGCLVRRKKNILLVFREPASVENEKSLEAQTEFLWDKRFRFKKKELSYDFQGITLGALGHRDLLMLSKKAPFDMNVTLRELPSKILQTFPAFRRNGALVSVPGLGYLSEKRDQVLSKSLIFEPPNPLIRNFFSTQILREKECQ